MKLTLKPHTQERHVRQPTWLLRFASAPPLREREKRLLRIVSSRAHLPCRARTGSLGELLSEGHPLSEEVKAPTPTDAAAGSGGRRRHAPDRLRFHRRGRALRGG